MKKYSVRFLHRAQIDIAEILAWLTERSPQGAARLVVALEQATERVKQFPLAFSIAPEAKLCGVEIRQVFFKTPKGRRYRLIVRIIGDEILVLRVRGPGQRTLTADELE